MHCKYLEVSNPRRCIVSQAPNAQASQENILEAVFARLDDKIVGLTRHLAQLKTIDEKQEVGWDSCRLVTKFC